MKIPPKYIRLWILKSFNKKSYDDCGENGLCGFLYFSSRFRLWRLFNGKLDLNETVDAFPELLSQKPEKRTHFSFWWNRYDFEVRQKVVNNAIKELQNEK